MTLERDPQAAMDRLNLAYGRFLAERTLSTLEPSEMRVESHDHLTLVIDPARAWPLCNRVLGFRVADLDRLAELRRLFEDAGVAMHIEVTQDDDTDTILRHLQSLGAAHEHDLTYRIGVPVPPPDASVSVERWPHERVDEFLAFLEMNGATCAPDVWAAKRELHCTDRFRGYVARIDGEAVARATMFVDGDGAYLGNAYTHIAHRGQGCQTALLRARMHDAAESGLAWIATDVVPGSASDRNCERMGLGALRTVHIWRLPTRG